eukprot:Tbor_TRINITY_DN5332_c1_g2::TRINITY_DN5332_c1_g2_i1::g.5156::m.5156/K08869/ADCK, ABC1; aarF domain-containing kinase
MSLFRKRGFRIAAGTLIVLPGIGVGSLVAYGKYRGEPQQSEKVMPFHPVVKCDGSLQMKDITIKPPSTWALFKRVIELIWIFMPLGFMYFFICWNRKLYILWAHRALLAIERAGPAFVKFGQWTCTRKDIFPEDIRVIFEKLYSNVSEHSIEDTLRVIEEEFKVKPEQIFSSIESKVCGSGSIGQVHIAYLKNTDEKVVIKVMHPNVIESISKDFFVINNLARFLDKYFPVFERFELVKLALAFTNHLAAQLDFRIEAENLVLFRENFKDVNYVEFPKPLMSTMRILVETFAAGEPATPDFLRSQQEHVRDILANKGLNCFCKMLLHDNFLHGDMHPGNILVDTSDPHCPIVTMIDVGLCQKLSGEEGPLTFNLMSSFVKWKAELCAESLYAMGYNQRFCNKEKFEKEIGVMFNQYRAVTGDENLVVTNILESLFEVVRENNVQMEPPYVSLLFAVLVLESFIMNLNPEFNMVRHAAPWLVSEGHLSKSLIRNFIRSSCDNIQREAGVMKGRLTQFIQDMGMTNSSNLRPDKC